MERPILKMTIEEKKKIFKTVGFVCGITQSMMDIFENMPEGLRDETVEKFYDYSIRDFANIWKGAASFPDDDIYDFGSILS